MKLRLNYHLFAPVLVFCGLLMATPATLSGAEETLLTNTLSPDYLVENWQLEEGLPRNTITAISEGPDGYLWLGSPNGLIRFDGERFVPYEESAIPAIAEGGVREIFKDRDGTLWVATRRFGLFHSKGDAVFSNAGGNDSWPRIAVDSIAQDRTGQLWISTGNGLLGKINNGRFEPVTRLDSYAKGPMLFKLVTDAEGELWFYKQDTFGRIENGNPTNITTIRGSVITLAPGRDGGMWISTGNDLRRLRAGENGAGEIVAQLSFGLYEINVLYEDHSGALWIGTARHGLFRFEHGLMQKQTSSNHAISAIYEDIEGNIWVGSNGAGLFKLRPPVFQVIGTSKGLVSDMVISVCGNFIAPAGVGLGRLQPSGEVKMSGQLSQNAIVSVMNDGAGGFWLGTAVGRLIHVTKMGRRIGSLSVAAANTQLRVLYRDHRGDLWIGCFPQGVFRLKAGRNQSPENLTSRGFSGSAITAIAEDAAGSLWIGTSRGELYQQLPDDRFQKYGPADGLPGAPIGTLEGSREGNLWIGTLGGGLGRWKNNRFTFINREAGLYDDVISQLVEDREGWLWIGSARGLFRVRTAALNDFMDGKAASVLSLHFGRPDGLGNIQCSAGSQPSVWKMRTGQLRFATNKGLVLVNPADMPVNKQLPRLYLEEILVDGVKQTNKADFKLPHNYKKIEFRYAAISFTAPDKVHSKHQLSNFDDDWVDDEASRSAVYPHLPPGRYQFRFMACNNDGLWNDKPFLCSFIVEPAVWQTTWFRIGALILFAGTVAGISRYISILRMRRRLKILEQRHALDRERARIARDLHDDLGARLTQMAFLTDLAAAEPAAPPEIKAQLGEVAQQARRATRSLDETVWMVNPKKDSLRDLIAYLGHYANEFFHSTPINCRQHICVNPPDCFLPGKLRHEIFFAIKEALNNVLKHSGATEVWLRIAVRGPMLCILIVDNGRGFLLSTANRRRHGLDNMRHRLESAGGQYILRSRPGKGTRLLFRIKLEIPPLHTGANSHQ